MPTLAQSRGMDRWINEALRMIGVYEALSRIDCSSDAGERSCSRNIAMEARNVARSEPAGSILKGVESLSCAAIIDESVEKSSVAMSASSSTSSTIDKATCHAVFAYDIGWSINL